MMTFFCVPTESGALAPRFREVGSQCGRRRAPQLLAPWHHADRSNAHEDPVLNGAGSR